MNTLKMSSRVSGQTRNPGSHSAAGGDAAAARTPYQHRRYKQAVVIAKVSLNLAVDLNLEFVTAGNGDIHTG